MTNNDASKPLSFADLIKLYNEKGATTTTSYETEQGTQYNTSPNELGDGWMAWEHAAPNISNEGYGDAATQIYGKPELGGFSRKDGDFVNFYDLNGKLVQRQKWNVGDFGSIWSDLGPIAMAALTMGGGAGMLGNALFGLEGAAAAGAGGALGGAFNAGMNDQNILTGALKGGLGSAGAMELGKLADKTITLGDVNKAINFAKDPSLAGAVNVASGYMPGDVKLGDTGLSVGDLFKGAGTAKALMSGDERQIFNALVGVDRNTSSPLKTSLGPGSDEEFQEGLIPGYFQPGGEGYTKGDSSAEESVFDPTFGGALPLDDEYSVAGNADEMTVREDPENLDAFLRELSPYQSDAEAGKSVFAQDEDIPEFETVDKRPVKQLSEIFDPMDLLNDQYAVAGNGEDMTVREDPENLDSFLRELNPYLADEQPGERTIPAERESDIKDDEIGIEDIGKIDSDINDILPTLPKVPAKTAPAAKQPNTSTTKTSNTEPKSQAQAAALMNFLSGNNDVAHIKSYKELFGHDLFEPAKAARSDSSEQQREYDDWVRPAQYSGSEGFDEEEFFKGGHVDDFSVDALLQILRS